MLWTSAVHASTGTGWARLLSSRSRPSTARIVRLVVPADVRKTAASCAAAAWHARCTHSPPVLTLPLASGRAWWRLQSWMLPLRTCSWHSTMVVWSWTTAVPNEAPVSASAWGAPSSARALLVAQAASTSAKLGTRLRPCTCTPGSRGLGFRVVSERRSGCARCASLAHAPHNHFARDLLFCAHGMTRRGN